MKAGEWSQNSDTELVIAAMIGNLEAFGELVGRFRPAVRAIVSGIVDSRESAEDVVQDTFLLAFKALPHLRNIENFASWLCAIARNRAIRYQQRERRSIARSPFDIFILQESKAFAREFKADPADAMEQEESCLEIECALDNLSQEHQVVLRLRYWSEMSLQSIADFLGVSLPVVKWRIYKGKQLLKKYLENKWEDEKNGRREERHSDT